MISSSALFDLIHSMSPSEKRYFKLHISKQALDGQKKHEKLFDLIEAQKVYNETEIKKKIGDEKVVGYFAAAKNYLYEVVKDSLFIYHLNLSKESVFKKELQIISLLYDKGLYDQCEKLVTKIEKRAAREELFLYQYEALIWRARLARNIIGRTNYNKLLEMTNNINEALEKESNRANYSRLMSLTSYLLRSSNNIKKSHTKNHVSEIIKDPLLSSEEKATSKTSKILYNYILQQYYFIALKDKEKAFVYADRNVKIFESAPDMIRDSPMNYVRSINNILWIGLDLEKYEECQHLISRMKNTINKNNIKLDEHSEASIFSLHSQVITTALIKKAEFEKVETIIDETEKKLLLLNEKIKANDRVVILFNIGYMFFGSGQYKKAVTWLQRLMNDQEESMQESRVAAGKIVSLLAYIELGDLDLVSYSLRSVQRFLKKRKIILKSELVFFKLVNSIIKNHNKKPLNAIYAETKTEFEKLKPEEISDAFEKIDFSSWLESKLKNKSFSAVSRSKIVS